jgi:hypothetical protein
MHNIDNDVGFSPSDRFLAKGIKYGTFSKYGPSQRQKRAILDLI